MFEAADGTTLGTRLETMVKMPQSEHQPIPVFINEAAYSEKHIALSLTQREVWVMEPQWLQQLEELLR